MKKQPKKKKDLKIKRKIKSIKSKNTINHPEYGNIPLIQEIVIRDNGTIGVRRTI